MQDKSNTQFLCKLHTIVSNTGAVHAMKKFKIPQIPQTTSKSIRFPNDVIDEVESVLVGTDCTFSAFVVEAVRVALENLKEESAEDE